MVINIEHILSEQNKETRIKKDKDHFATLIEKENSIAIRLNPLKNKDSWGSTIYLQPFMPYSRFENSNPVMIENFQKNLILNIGGEISGLKKDKNKWNINSIIKFDKSNKKIEIEGQYKILLNEPTHNLNLLRVSSNYLYEVPLLSNRIGNTGDISKIIYTIDEKKKIWNPLLNPSHFPQDTAQKIKLELKENYNNIDTKAQGYESIKAVNKPNILIDLQSEDIDFLFGGMYDLNKSKKFWEDNIGVVVLSKSNMTEYIINFRIRSYATTSNSLYNT